MRTKISYLVLVAPARILGSIEIKWGVGFKWDRPKQDLVSVSKETQNFPYNFSMVLIQWHIWHFPNSIYLDPYPSLPPFIPQPHLFPNTPVIKDKRVEFFHYLNCINSLSSHLVSIYQSYTINDILLNIYAKVFGREIQPHEMVTQSPAMIFNQW